MKVSLALLTFNELPGCKVDVPKLPRDLFDEVFAVDGGSKDGTAEYLREQGIRVHTQRRRGLNQAYLEAAEQAPGDALVVFFPKGTVSPDVVRDIHRHLQMNDLVIASRNLPGGHNEEDDKLLRPRKWAAGVLSHVIHAAWGRGTPRITDVLHGIKGFRKDAFARVALTDLKVTVDLELAVRSYRLGLRTVEFPVRESPRFYGETHFKMIACGIEYLKFFRYELLQRRQN
jgi:glycosyltransferase involved in cell wall biosynthesis